MNNSTQSSLIRCKRRLQKFVLALLSIILFFSLAEITLRLIKFHVNQTGGYFKFGCFNWVADKYNIPIKQRDPYLFWRCNRQKERFRDRHHPLVKPKDTYRIICLGDSTTQGFTLPPIKTTLEESYPYKLEELLNKNNNTTYFEVINAGCGGYSSFQGLRFLKSELLKYDPDLLIIWFGMNDNATAILYSDKEQKFPNEIITKVEKILNRSKFCQFYRQCLFYLLSILKRNNNSKKRVSAEDYHENLKEMVELGKEYNIATVFIIPFERHGPAILLFQAPGYRKVFEEFLEENIPVIDMAAIFKPVKDTAKYFYDICHTTPEGNQIIAEAVYGTLVKEGLVATP